MFVYFNAESLWLSSMSSVMKCNQFRLFVIVNKNNTSAGNNVSVNNQTVFINWTTLFKIGKLDPGISCFKISDINVLSTVSNKMTQPLTATLLPSVLKRFQRYD